MSALWPHIRALRAEAKALNEEASGLGATTEQLTAKFVLFGMASAKLSAADELEAGQNELLERITAAAKEA